uniref:Secreted protein n=1 Tax=Heterorhabditis bacteriophora TaxID=37862 RepID=A0A1I7WWZ5_HETBA
MLSALYSFDAFSAPRSAASCAVGRLSTLASAGPSPLHPAYNNLGYLQVFFNTIQQQQQNGVDGGWRGGSEGEPASNGAPVACSECKLLRQ